MSRLLDRRAIERALQALAGELEARGVRGNLFVVGGAALALAYNARRSTRDIDAVFEPKDVVYQAAGVVAQQLGLDPDWINDAVKGFMPGPDPNPVPVFESPGLQVAAASPRYLLAMKLLSARPELDADDIRFLCQLLGLKRAEEGLAILAEMYPNRPVLPRTRFLLEEMFPAAPSE